MGYRVIPQLHYNVHEFIHTIVISILLHGGVKNVYGSSMPPGDEPDRIHSLPGLSSQPNFHQYAGYLQGVNENIQLFYWFVEAQNDSASAPLLLWLNGGPGCSSLHGLLNEHGPFITRENSQLEINLQSWNKFANVLYLESPPKVGFSYTKEKRVIPDDDKTSLNNYHALLNFLEKYPRYKGRDFYISGKSYAGIYLPTLAVRIIEGKSRDLNLRGVAVGNGFFNETFNENSQPYYLYYRGLIDDRVWKEALKTCCGSECDRCFFTESENVDCSRKYYLVDGNYNPYNIHSQCPRSDTFAKSKLKTKMLNQFTALAELQKAWVFQMAEGSCDASSSMKNYLNKQEVWKALNVKSEFIDSWELCNYRILSRYERTYQDVSPQIRAILRAAIPIMFYVGDNDLVCNFVGIKWFFDSFELQHATPLRSWFYTNLDGKRHVGGAHKSIQIYNAQLQYVTVLGAGHSVPTDRPGAAYHLLQQFIAGEEI